MIAVLFSLSFIAMLAVLYIYHLIRLTRPENTALRQALNETVGVGVLLQLEGGHLQRVHQVVTRSQRLWHDRDVMLKFMPMMLQEARRVASLGRGPLVRLHFALFRLAYSLLRAKIRLWPSVWDMRYLCAAELPLLRRAAQTMT